MKNLCEKSETDLSLVLPLPLPSSPVSKRRQQLSKGGLNLELTKKGVIPARKYRGKRFQETNAKNTLFSNMYWYVGISPPTYPIPFQFHASSSNNPPTLTWKVLASTCGAQMAGKE